MPADATRRSGPVRSQGFQQRNTLLAVAAWILLIPGANLGAQPSASRPAPAYTNEIRQLEERRRARESELDWLSRDYAELGDFGKSDRRLLLADYDRLMAGCDEAIAAYRKGLSEEGRRLAQAAERMSPDRDWRRRFLARQRQSQSWPPDEWVYHMETDWSRPWAQPSAARFVAARRQAAQAWARLAEAIEPEALPARLIELEDLAYRAEAETKIAEGTWRLYSELAAKVPHREIQSEELTQSIQAFEALQGELAAMHRDRNDVERRQRAWDRAWEELENRLEESYQKTRQAHEAAQKAARNP